MRIKIGELLVRAGVVTEAQLTQALLEQRKTQARLGDTLVKLGIITEDLLVKALAKQLGIPRADLGAPVVGAALRRMDRNLARTHEAVPIGLSEDGRTLTVAMADPLDMEIVEKLRASTGARIVAYLAGPSAVRTAIDRFYPPDGSETPATQAVDPRKVIQQINAQQRQQPRIVTGPQPARAAPRSIPAPAMPVTPPPQSASSLLKSMEEVQHREITALRAMVELLIDKGVFSREEYLARMKR